MFSVLSQIADLKKLAFLLVFGAFLGGEAFAYTTAEIRSVERSEEAQIRKLREHEINQISIALSRGISKQRKADLYFRLAEIYLEAYRTTFILEGRVHERKRRRGTIERNQSKPFLRKGIESSEKVLALNVPYSKLDRVYYFLGFNYGELGDQKNSFRYYNLLTRKFPNSEVAKGAFKELGEAAFKSRNYSSAVKYFRKALESGDLDSRAEVLHKLAWSYYRLRRTRQAVETMKDAVQSAEASGEKYVSVKDEALRDMALFMTETNQAEDAIRYFKEVAGDLEFFPTLLENLAKEFERKGQANRAEKVFEALLSIEGDSDKKFKIQAKLIDLDIRQKSFESALKRLQAIKSLPSPDEGTEVWTVLRNLQAMTRRIATENHDAFRRRSVKNTSRALKVAEGYYSVYINLFLNRADPRNERPEIKMYLAEVKRDLGALKEASDLYYEVFKSEDPRYSKEAGVLWVASLEDRLKKVSRKKRKELSEEERTFVDASLELEKAMPGSVQALEASLKAAQILAGYSDRHSEAVDRIKRIIKVKPKSRQAHTAAALWVQIYTDRLPSPRGKSRDSYSDAADDVRDVLEEVESNKELMAYDKRSRKSALTGLIKERREQIRIDLITLYEKKSDWKKVAEEYEDFSKRDGVSISQKVTAISNAISSYFKAEEYDEAFQKGISYLESYSKSSTIKRALRDLAGAFFIIGRFDRSAELFELLGNKASEESSMQISAKIYQAIGNREKANTIRKNFLDKFRSSQARWSVALDLGKSYENGSSETEAAKVFTYCMGGPEQYHAECSVALADLYTRLGNADEANAIFKKLSLLRPSSKSGNGPFIGYARYKIAENFEKSGRFLALKMPEKNLERALAQRMNFFERLTAAYNRAVEAGGPWGIAALNNLAKWTANFADEVDAIEPLERSDSKALKQFQNTLSTISAPLRKKALDTWKRAYKIADSGQILSPAIREIGDSVSDMNRKREPRAQGSFGVYELSGTPPEGEKGDYDQTLEKIRDRLLKSTKDRDAWVGYGNLLFGVEKFDLAQIAYEQAADISTSGEDVKNNLAVLLVRGEGQKNWIRANLAHGYFEQASKSNKFALTSKKNLATLLNYYRLFRSSLKLWPSVSSLKKSPETYFGRAIAEQGVGRFSNARSYFKQGEKIGGRASSFEVLYHEAARWSKSSKKGPENCRDVIGRVNFGDLKAFELDSAKHLKEMCEKWDD